MSFTFDGAGDRLTGTLTSTYAGPVTLAAFIKVTAHPVAVDAILELGNSNSATADSFAIGTGSTDDTWRARSTDSVPTSSFATTAAFNVDGVWAGIVGVFTSSTLRDAYIQSIGQTAQSTQARTVAGVLKYIAAGQNLASGADFTGKIAEVAIWNAALTTQQITNYLAGVAASTIAAANLIEYVPMSTNNLVNLGLDAGGGLTAFGNAVFDADHPVIGTTPIFDSAPVVSSQTASAYTISYDASASAVTLYTGAYLRNATAPTAAQIKAGTNAHGTASEATTGSADSIVLTPSESTKFPVYDLYCVLENASGFSPVVALTTKYLNAPSGFQFTVLDVPWGGSEDSVLNGASPAAVDGDVMVMSALTSPGGYAVTPGVAGTASFNPGSDTARQTFTARFYDVSVGDYSDAAGVITYVNNVTPVYTPGDFVDPVLMERNAVFTDLPLEPLWTDAEGDAMTVTFQDTLPAGLTNTAETLVGTPTVYGTTPAITMRSQDVTGEYSEHDITIVVGPRVPNVVNTAEAAAIAAIAAVASLSAVVVLRTASESIVSGNVISQDPLSNTLVGPTDQIALVISTGNVAVAVPNLIGLSQAAAQSAIAAAGFVLGTVSYQVDLANLYKVVAQQPAAQLTVDPGSTVNYTVGVLGTVVKGHGRRRR